MAHPGFRVFSLSLLRLGVLGVSPLVPAQRRTPRGPAGRFLPWFLNEHQANTTRFYLFIQNWPRVSKWYRAAVLAMEREMGATPAEKVVQKTIAYRSITKTERCEHVLGTR